MQPGLQLEEEMVFDLGGSQILQRTVPPKPNSQKLAFSTASCLNLLETGKQRQRSLSAMRGNRQLPCMCRKPDNEKKDTDENALFNIVKLLTAKPRFVVTTFGKRELALRISKLNSGSYRNMIGRIETGLVVIQDPSQEELPIFIKSD